MPLLQLHVFLDRHQIHRPHCADPLAEGVDLGLDLVPGGGLERGQVGFRGLPARLVPAPAGPRGPGGLGFRLFALARRVPLGQGRLLLVQVEFLQALGLVLSVPKKLFPIQARDFRGKLARHLLGEKLRALPVLGQLHLVGAQFRMRGLRLLADAGLGCVECVDLGLDGREFSPYGLHLLLGDPQRL